MLRHFGIEQGLHNSDVVRKVRCSCPVQLGLLMCIVVVVASISWDRCSTTMVIWATELVQQHPQVKLQIGDLMEIEPSNLGRNGDMIDN